MSSPSQDQMGALADVPRAATMEFDDGTGAVAAFHGDPALFAVTHVPAESNGIGVVICSPIFNDYLKNNRREILLGRRLASMGFTAMRFHYAGTGNSDGERLDLHSMIDDAGRAAETLSQEHDLQRVIYMGTRLGSIPAAICASRDNAPVVMWEPIEGPMFFREIFRMMAIVGMNASDAEAVPLSEIKASFEANGTMDAGGFEVDWDFFTNSDRGVIDALGAGSAPVFLAQFRDKAELKAGYRKLVDAWTEQGRDVSVHHMLVDEAWMLFVYGFQAEEERAHTKELVEATAEWFGAQA